MAPLILPRDRRNDCPRVIGSQDGPVIRARARASDRAPLTHANAVAVSMTLNGQRCQAAIGILPALHRKVGAVEDLATCRAKHEADVVRSERELPARGADAEHV